MTEDGIMPVVPMYEVRTYVSNIYHILRREEPLGLLHGPRVVRTP